MLNLLAQGVTLKEAIFFTQPNAKWKHILPLIPSLPQSEGFPALKRKGGGLWGFPRSEGKDEAQLGMDSSRSSHWKLHFQKVCLDNSPRSFLRSPAWGQQETPQPRLMGERKLSHPAQPFFGPEGQESLLDGERGRSRQDEWFLTRHQIWRADTCHANDVCCSSLIPRASLPKGR